MGHFLRDRHIKNLTITEEALRTIAEIFEQKIETTNLADGDPARLQLSYIIRFDNKGYRVFSADELLSCFRQSTKVDRINFTVANKTADETLRKKGEFADLILTNEAGQQSNLQVSSDSSAWCDSCFTSISEVLEKFKNKNGLIRNTWTTFLVQILGVLYGFIFCIWLASRISPHINVENSLLVTLLFLLVIFSNFWTHIYSFVLKFLGRRFPNIQFNIPGSNSFAWLWQSIVGAVLVGCLLHGSYLFTNLTINIINDLTTN